jgi:hypothetical protein
MGYLRVLEVGQLPNLVGRSEPPVIWFVKIELELGLIFGTRKKPERSWTGNFFEDRMFLGKKKGLELEVNRIAKLIASFRLGIPKTRTGFNFQNRPNLNFSITY